MMFTRNYEGNERLHYVNAFANERQIKLHQDDINRLIKESSRTSTTWQRMFLEALVNPGVNQQDVETIGTEIGGYPATNWTSGSFRTLVGRWMALSFEVRVVTAQTPRL